ncbi:MAG: ORF6N domain-containing protein, partial [Betaproteobacteria bacterium]|nr:ORF6N domain-containing protein [Betaproteobacteria bacterium]
VPTRRLGTGPGRLAARVVARGQVLRGLKLMIDADLAALYGMPTKALNQAQSASRRPGRMGRACETLHFLKHTLRENEDDGFHSNSR